MKTQDFTTGITVDQSPADVFSAINNVRGWWSEEISGGTAKLNDEFLYHFKDIHIVKMRLVDVTPNERVVWLVLNNYFSFITDQSEWKGTRIIFEIDEKDEKTQLRFTHQGLVPDYECYEVCYDAWSTYIKQSLRDLITIGKGQPNPKENGFTPQLLKQWGMPQ